MAEQRIVHYTGRVQGVGFRATTERLARGLSVFGYVRNLADGRVELVAEGEPSEIERLLARVRGEMGANLTDESSETVEPTDSYKRFAIRY